MSFGDVVEATILSLYLRFPSFLVRLQNGHRAPDLLRYRANQTFVKHFSFSK